MPEDVKSFVDTNILIYAYDTSAQVKHKRAAALLTKLWHSGLGVVSTQVLQEFAITVRQKIAKPLSMVATQEIVKGLLQWEVIVNDGEAVLSALQLSEKHKLSFWDALIVNAAAISGAERLYSEDLSHGQKILGLRVLNPLLD